MIGSLVKDADGAMPDDRVRRMAEAHYDDVLAYCRRHAPSYADAQDIAQEVFLRLARGVAAGKGYRDQGKPLAYLLTTARNLCIDAARQRFACAVWAVGPLEHDVADPAAAADGIAAGDVELASALALLPAEEREVVELRFDQGLSVAEAAEVLGVSRFAAHRRLKRALAALRRRLEATEGTGNDGRG